MPGRSSTVTEAAIRVYLILGFTGSGKTTLVNRIVEWTSSATRLMVLINDFGDQELKPTLIRERNVEVLELAVGSTFCVCEMGDFLKILHRIAFVLKPEALVFEACGLADPLFLEKAIENPLLKGAFTVKGRFCVVDAAHFLDQFETLVVTEKLAASGDCFIINKIDMSEKETVDRVKNVILSLNPEAKLVETCFARTNLEDIFGPGI